MPIQDRSLSVVLPIYQQADFLPLILTALEQQTYRGRWNLMVCDDGSTQDVLHLLRDSNLSKQVEIQYFWQPDKGFRAGRARNRGIQCTTEDVVVFLDGDCLPGPGFLSGHAAAHDGSRRIVCGSRSYLFLETCPLTEIAREVQTTGVHALTRRAHMPTRPFQLARMRGGSPWTALCGCNFSVLRTPELAFDEEYVGWGIEDYELGLRLWSEHGFELVCEPSVCVLHLEETSPAIFHPLRPKTSSQIAHYVANVLRVSERHPSADLCYLWKTLNEFSLDADGIWQLAQAGVVTGKGGDDLTMYRIALEWQETEA